MIRAGAIRKYGRGLGALVALSLFISLVLMLFYAERFRGAGLSEVVSNWLVGSVFGICIGGLSWVSLAWVAPRIWWESPALKWAKLLGVMLVTTVIGAWVAAVVIKHVLPFEVNGTVMGIWWRSLRTSLTIAVIVGTLMTVIEGYKHRLERNELERERAQKLAAEAQLAALASRVEPHFLFNTLNSITALIREDPAQAERMVERLSGLLRSSLEAGRAALVPLDQEMQLVADYLEIQRTRFGGRLQIELERAEMAAQVPPFAIQTLVENSVKYAVAPRPEGGRIRVRLTQEEGCVRIDVEDDGPGFEASAIREGHGIDNVRGRLTASLGERAGLEFARRESGMLVRLRVPL